MSTGQLFFDGNSLTSSSTYPAKTLALLTGSWSSTNVAQNGGRTTDLIAAAPTVIDAAQNGAMSPHIVVIWEGSNDLKLGATAASAYQNLVAYCQARRAAGLKVVLLTILPRTQVGLPATFEADRSTVNTNLRANWTNYADALVDVGAQADIGPAGSQANPTYYSDGVHLTEAGDALVAGMVAPTLEAIYEGEPMAGGPYFPHSQYPVTSGNLFASFHAATNAHREGLQVAASIGADSTWRLWFQLPPTLPTGTCKLLLRAVSTATSGAAKVNPKWKSFAAEETISSPTLNAETTNTITWAAGDNDQLKELKITLDADTPVAGEEILLDLVFETTGWTLAVVSTWTASIIFE